MATRQKKGPVVRDRRLANQATRGDAAEDTVIFAPDDDVLAAADRIAERDSELLRRLAQ